MNKRSVLREEKRLKTIRRRNERVKTHNFITKTLPKVGQIFEGMSQQEKDKIHADQKRIGKIIIERRK